MIDFLIDTTCVGFCVSERCSATFHCHLLSCCPDVDARKYFSLGNIRNNRFFPSSCCIGSGLHYGNPRRADRISLVYGGVTTLLVCVTASTSFAMLFPISTHPNAIASSTGLIKTHDMTLVGIIVGVIGLILSYTVLLLFPF